MKHSPTTTVKKKGKWIGEFAPNLGHDPNNPFPLPKQEGDWEKKFDEKFAFKESPMEPEVEHLYFRMEDEWGWRAAEIKDIKDFIASELSKSHQQGYAEGKQAAYDEVKKALDGIKALTKETDRGK